MRQHSVVRLSRTICNRSPAVGCHSGVAYRERMTQPELPEWAAALPITSPRPTPKPATEHYQHPIRDVEVREEQVGGALIRWAFNGETGAFDSARVYNGSGWQVGHYQTVSAARDAATKANESA